MYIVRFLWFFPFLLSRGGGVSFFCVGVVWVLKAERGGREEYQKKKKKKIVNTPRFIKKNFKNFLPHTAFLHNYWNFSRKSGFQRQKVAVLKKIGFFSKFIY